MDFLTVGSSLGVLSSVVHLFQGVIHISKHLKIKSTCCGLKSSFELDIDTPKISPGAENPLVENNGFSK